MERDKRVEENNAKMRELGFNDAIITKRKIIKKKYNKGKNSYGTRVQPERSSKNKGFVNNDDDEWGLEPLLPVQADREDEEGDEYYEEEGDEDDEEEKDILIDLLRGLMKETVTCVRQDEECDGKVEFIGSNGKRYYEFKRRPFYKYSCLKCGLKWQNNTGAEAKFAGLLKTSKIDFFGVMNPDYKVCKSRQAQKCSRCGLLRKGHVCQNPK